MRRNGLAKMYAAWKPFGGTRPWKAWLRRIRRCIVCLLLAAAVILNGFGLFHTNCAVPLKLVPHQGREFSIYHFLVQHARQLGLAQLWRMYTPVEKEIHRVRLWAKLSTGEWSEIDLGLSPGLSSDFFSHDLDFKRARARDELLFSRPAELFAERYLKSTMNDIEARLGTIPVLLRMDVEKARIPSPDRLGSWTIQNAKFHHIRSIELNAW